MQADPETICQGAVLQDGGQGVRFEVMLNGRLTPAFVIRYDGRVHGYLNQCAHVPMELDWAEGQFFESSGQYLMCATHGALYEPDTGRCVGGPCRGAVLRALRVEELADAAGETDAAAPDVPNAARIGAGTRVVWWPDDLMQATGDVGEVAGR